MITLVDYGLGNIQAFAEIYKRLNLPVTVAQRAEQLQQARKIILPGVGAFDWAMERLEASGMREMLERLVMQHQVPVLGVCVGMQMMARSSEEGQRPGLGWIPAHVRRMDDSQLAQKTCLPHMGWNDVEPCRRDCLFKGMDAARFYFLHSYHFVADRDADVLARTDYNGAFTSATRAGHVFGTQFHPEKSHQWGIQLLKNFAEL